MTRFLSFIGLMLLIGSSFGLYQLKYQVQRMDRQARALQAENDHERANIQILDAEWTYLNQPQRVQALSERFLQLKPAVPGQVATLDDIPFKGAEHSPAPRIASRVEPRDGHPGAVRTAVGPTLATIRAPAVEDDQ